MGILCQSSINPSRCHAQREGRHFSCTRKRLHSFTQKCISSSNNEQQSAYNLSAMNMNSWRQDDIIHSLLLYECPCTSLFLKPVQGSRAGFTIPLKIDWNYEYFTVQSITDKFGYAVPGAHELWDTYKLLAVLRDLKPLLVLFG